MAWISHRSFILAKLSITIIPSSYPQEDLYDLALWRAVPGAFQSLNNLLHKDHSVTTKDVMIDSYKDQNYAPIRVRLYTPKSELSDTLSKDVVMWFHGGGFVVGGIEPDDALCSELARESNAIVVSVEYRLAPEYKFPTPPEDCTSATQWVSNHISEFGGNPNKIFVMGESAGGNLAAAVTSYNLDESKVPVKDRVSIIGSVLIYPAVDIGGQETESYDLYGNMNGILTSEQARRFARLYCGPGDMKQCNANYLFAPTNTPEHTLHQYPPTLVVLAKHDVLLDEGLRFAANLKRLKVTTDLVVYNSTTHYFFGKHIYTHGYSALRDTAEKIREISRRHFVVEAAVKDTVATPTSTSTSILLSSTNDANSEVDNGNNGKSDASSTSAGTAGASTEEESVDNSGVSGGEL